MTGYDSKARILWQKSMGEMHTRTGVIWMVTTNPLFKIAAKTMTLLTRYKMKPVESEQQILQLVSV